MLTPIARRALMPVTCAGLLCVPVTAQGQLHQLTGTSLGHDFGVAVGSAGDLDGDGFGDVIVGASLAGTATVYSGKTGLALRTLPPTGPRPNDTFGRAVVLAGDLDADGFVDLGVGAPQLGAGTGRRGYVEVFSGRTGFSLLAIQGTADGDAFGFALASGDIDADGAADLVVGAPQNGAGSASGPGYIAVFSARGAKVFIAGRAHGDAFGYAIAVADVLTGDEDDILVGAPQLELAATASGYVQLVSGTLGGAFTTIGLATPGALLGHAVAAADVDGDGLSDPILGAPRSSSGGALAGRVLVFPRAAGSRPFNIFGAPGDQFGFALSRLGDTDGSGGEEFAVGAPQFDPMTGAGDPGYVRVFSGATERFTVRGGTPRDAFGFAVAGAADVNGNGLADLIVGAPMGFPIATGPGYALIYSGICGPSAAFGSGCPGSGGFVPSLTAADCATPGGNLVLSIGGALGGSAAALVLGGGRGSLPLGGGCQLLVAPLFPVLLGPLPVAGSGAGGGSVNVLIRVPFKAPTPAVLTLQALVLDPGSAIGLAGSAGLEVTLR